jgi:hypothetical protein
VLALFGPLIISSGGNSGSQAATLIVRALAVQEIPCTTGGWSCAARFYPACYLESFWAQ